MGFALGLRSAFGEKFVEKKKNNAKIFGFDRQECLLYGMEI